MTYLKITTGAIGHIKSTIFIKQGDLPRSQTLHREGDANCREELAVK